jgi:hypothetical protein
MVMKTKILFISIIFFVFCNSSFSQDEIRPKIKGLDKVYPTYTLKNDLIGSVSDRLIFYEVRQDELNPLARDINYPVLYGMGALTIGTGLTIHFYQKNAWWADQSRVFRIQDDWDYALWIDKIGHFYGTILISHAMSASLEACNLPAEDCVVYGSLGAFLFQAYIEYEDGFGLDWGFSPGDFMSDFLGAMYPVAQYYIPYLNNFQFRVSYYPKHLSGANPITGHKHIIVDDYEGQKFWLSFKMKNLLPKDVAKYWPGFLQLSLGMGVRDLDGSGGGISDFYLAFDIDADYLPISGSFGQFIKNTLNLWHFPMPGIRINNKTVFFAICY